MVLSYQYVATTCHSATVVSDETNTISRIIYPKRGKRLTLKNFIGQVIRHALAKKVITSVPEHIYLVAHFIRADLGCFAEFFTDPSIQVQGVRNTLVTTTHPYEVAQEELLGKMSSWQEVRVYDNNHNAKKVKVRFIDTQLLTPNQSGLACLGEMVGLPKLAIPAPYSIERMAEYLEKDTAGFEQYALRDAEIVHRYVMQFFDFTQREFGRAYLPVSLGNIAVHQFEKTLKAHGIEKASFLGMKTDTVNLYNTNRGKYQRKKCDRLVATALTFERFAIECYHGGRNEAFVCGYPPIGEYYDFDLPSAYTTAMLNIYPVDFERCRCSQNVADFKCDVLGLARVTFAFPEGTRYPSLPVKTHNGLIFPLTGESYCTSPEIENAVKQGCQITIKEGYLFDWLNQDQRPFEDFVKFIRSKRSAYKKGELSELLWKEVGNSLYGKLAQGLKGKTTFNTQLKENKPVPRSAITCAFYACYITGFTRALIGELLNSIPPDKFAVSVTTDGFLTNARLDELDFSGTLSSRYKALLDSIMPEGDNAVLEEKHRVKQLCCMKTRGQFTVLQGKVVKGKADSAIVLAKSSVQVPSKIKLGVDKTQYKEAENAFMMNLYFNRTPQQKMRFSSLASPRKNYIHQMDTIRLIYDKKLNLEFDMKRCLVNAIAVNIGTNNDEKQGVFMLSIPWKDEEQFYNARAYFTDWTQTRLLKTVEDFADWNEFYLAKCSTKGRGVNVGKGRTEKVLLNQFLRCYVRKSYGTELMTETYKELAERLTLLGYSTTETAIKNAKRRNVKITTACVPDTPKVKELLKHLLTICPAFEYQAFFNTDITLAS